MYQHICELLTADKGYDTNANHRHPEGNGQRSSIMVEKNRLNPQVMRWADPESWRKRPSIEHKFDNSLVVYSAPDAGVT